jgi:hypothetical protein
VGLGHVKRIGRQQPDDDVVERPGDVELQLA